MAPVVYECTDLASQTLALLFVLRDGVIFKSKECGCRLDPSPISGEPAAFDPEVALNNAIGLRNRRLVESLYAFCLS